MNMENIRSVGLSEGAVCVTLAKGAKTTQLYAKAKALSKGKFTTREEEMPTFKKVFITFKDPSKTQSMFAYLSANLVKD